MSNDILIGGQWGDEGKAKIIDFLAKDYDIVLRTAGGANAGHSVVVDNQKFVFHLIPSGILYPDVTVVLGNGVVLDLDEILSEIKYLKEKSITITGRLKISSSCHIVLPFHKIIDREREKKKKDKIGTTQRGIGPAYSDKITRIGVRLCDLEDKEKLAVKLQENIKEKKVLFDKYYMCDYKFNIIEIADELHEKYLQVKDYIVNNVYYLNNSIKENKSILFEGAQGHSLDIDFGTYPFVTSSNPTVGGAITGSGISVKKINRVIGIFKAYLTRVGEGPFPTKMSPEDAEILRKVGCEYGATTGRPRDCGWFDLVEAKYSCMVNGFTDLAITKLDVLDKYKQIKICTGYEIDGKVTNEFPVIHDDFQKIVPVYKSFDGWQSDITKIRKYNDLPENAKIFLEFVEKEMGSKISYVSIGPDRTETIIK